MTKWESLLARALLILRSAASAGALAREWSLGGGTALMLRFHHRASEDIDIFVTDPQMLGYLSPRLNPVAESLTPDYAEGPGFVKLYFPEGQVVFIVSGHLTASPITREIVLGREIPLETPAEIVAKKLWYRAADFTARDIFDLAFVARREPRAILQTGDVLRMRRDPLLKRLLRAEEALREQFEALDVLQEELEFDDCMREIRGLLSEDLARRPPRVEQPRARYRAEKRGLSPIFIGSVFVPRASGPVSRITHTAV